MDHVITHPVPLTVHDVVPDLHVVDDLGNTEPNRTGDPYGWQPGKHQRSAGAHLEATLTSNDGSDVRSVILAELVDHRLTDRVEFGGECGVVKYGVVKSGLLRSGRLRSWVDASDIDA